MLINLFLSPGCKRVVVPDPSRKKMEAPQANPPQGGKGVYITYSIMLVFCFSKQLFFHKLFSKPDQNQRKTSAKPAMFLLRWGSFRGLKKVLIHAKI